MNDTFEHRINIIVYLTGLNPYSNGDLIIVPLLSIKPYVINLACSICSMEVCNKTFRLLLQSRVV